MIDFSINAGAMSSLATAMQVTANNVANVNTEEFKASRVTFEDVANQGGMRVQDIQETSAEGALVPVDKPVEDENGKLVQTRSMVQSSNTDIARESVNMISTEHAFAANAAVIRTWDDMIGGLLDEMV